MGCDIHLYREKQIDGKWVAADNWVADGEGRAVPYEQMFTARDYNLFGLLAEGVRRDHPFAFKQRALPFDACVEVRSEFEEWGPDAHSASYLYLHELQDTLRFLAGRTLRVSGMKNAEGLAALHASIASGSPNWDLLYPYCAWTSDPTAVEFQIDVPADYLVGDNLADIISRFDGVEGTNQRIVFWFDN